MINLLGESGVATGAFVGAVTGALALGAAICTIVSKAMKNRRECVDKYKRRATPAIDPQQCLEHGVKIAKVETRVDGLETAIDKGFTAVHGRIKELRDDNKQQLDRIEKRLNV